MSAISYKNSGFRFLPRPVFFCPCTYFFHFFKFRHFWSHWLSVIPAISSCISLAISFHTAFDFVKRSVSPPYLACTAFSKRSTAARRHGWDCSVSVAADSTTPAVNSRHRQLISPLQQMVKHALLPYHYITQYTMCQTHNIMQSLINSNRQPQPVQVLLQFSTSRSTAMPISDNRSTVYHAKPSRARYCQGKLSVCNVKVLWSYRLGFCEIISRLINLTISLSADSNMTDLLQREHPKF